MLQVCNAAYGAPAVSAAQLPRPSASQLAWENAAVGLFLHYDLQVAHPHWTVANARTRDPFLCRRPPNTDQWLRVAKAMGAKYAVYVCKHDSGYMFFQCHAYPFGLSYSKWGGGKVDMVRRFVDSCHKFGIKPGLYCSLATNRFWHVTGNYVRSGKGRPAALQAAYARICEQMETRLWSHYGPLFYCWFDGGELSVKQGGPDLTPLLQKFQPKMVGFQGPVGMPGGLTRWIGNEAGYAPNPCWETVSQPSQPGGGDANGKLWQPAEVDISVLAGDQWFWRPGRANPMLTLRQLVNIYYDSVGHGCNLIVNAPIDPHGRIAKTVRDRLAEFGREIRRRFSKPLGQTSGTGHTVVLAFGHAVAINNIMIMEAIAHGQRVRQYQVQGRTADRWVTICRGQSIGHEWLWRFKPIKVTAVRLVVLKSIGKPMIRRLAAYDVK